MIDPAGQRPPFLTVSQLNAALGDLLEQAFPFLWLEGEVSNLRIPASGHCYLTLKDEGSQIRGVLFRGQRQGVPFELRDGQKLLCLGRVGVYRPRGEYQFIIEQVEAAGVGSLHLAFEQLKERLGREGLFDEGRKRPLPPHPKRIGIVTSPTGAALRDILKVLRRRGAGLEAIISPAAVQGEGAPAEIVRAIERLNRLDPPDAIIVGRGGGSIEDLWAFNDESVARAICASGVPVISAVGHETDYTIADFAADLRAPTPSAAAEMVALSSRELAREVGSLEGRLRTAMAGITSGLRLRLDRESKGLKGPARRIAEGRMRIDELLSKMERGTAGRVTLLRARLEGMAGRLDSLSPLAVLARGYAIATHPPRGRPLRDASEVGIDDEVGIILSKGELTCRVTGRTEG